MGNPQVCIDDNGRPHRETGPAIIWEEDNETHREWWWHGQKVEQQWIEDKDGVDVKAVFPKLANQEIRKAFCEILGWQRIVRALDAKKINEDWRGVLWEADVGDDSGRPGRWCQVWTEEDEYWLRVPPDTETCEAGIAWCNWLDDPQELKGFAAET